MIAIPSLVDWSVGAHRRLVHITANPFAIERFYDVFMPVRLHLPQCRCHGRAPQQPKRVTLLTSSAANRRFRTSILSISPLNRLRRSSESRGALWDLCRLLLVIARRMVSPALTCNLPSTVPKPGNTSIREEHWPDEDHDTDTPPGNMNT